MTSNIDPCKRLSNHDSETGITGIVVSRDIARAANQHTDAAEQRLRADDFRWPRHLLRMSGRADASTAERQLEFQRDGGTERHNVRITAGDVLHVGRNIALFLQDPEHEFLQFSHDSFRCNHTIIMQKGKHAPNDKELAIVLIRKSLKNPKMAFSRVPFDIHVHDIK